jgi:Tol biopolymer transport system component
MPILPGRRLGPYEILSSTGAGGMGEVYRARDTRLDRIVAIKVLPTHLADRSELRERFEREARVIASLNHPHICTLHDIGQQDGIDYLVMEYLEGETLAQRLLKGPLPLDQVLQYSIEISDALDKAHRKGITHRDLKPGNIMLTKSGTKLLDFGLAKLKQEAAPAIPDSQLPTMKSAITGEGTILGTLQYMAPEQVEAKEVDARTDIFAFGAVVYEMATGRKAFEGKTSASVMAKILEVDPPSMASLQPMTPPALDHVVKRCLAKDPDDRWQTARDLEFDLRSISEPGPHGVDRPASTFRSKGRLWFLAAATAIAFITAVVAYIFHYFPAAIEEKGAFRLSVLPPEDATFETSYAPTISPDGRRVAFVATQNGKSLLWVRDLNSLIARALPGTDGAYEPFWSPESHFLAFFASGKLRKINVEGGPALSLCEAAIGRGGSWSQNGIIVFAPNDRSGLFSVPAAGGTATPITELDQASSEASHRLPWFLPDGRHFLFTAWSTPEKTAIYVADVGSKSRHRVLTAFSNAIYVSPGYLLFMRERTLMAQPFDPGRAEIAGEPVAVAEQVDYSQQIGTQGQFSASQNGILVYASNARGTTQLTWFDRSGKTAGVVGSPGLMGRPVIAPDRSAVVVDRLDLQTGFSNLWLHDLARGTASRLTFDSQSNDVNPIWSPQGDQIAFSSNRDGSYKLYRKDIRGAAEEIALDTTEYNKQVSDWSSDGRYIIEDVNSPTSGGEMWVLPLFGDRKPFLYVRGLFGKLSPNAKWLAYNSDETKRFEVYVQPFPRPGRKWQVSVNGGYLPIWGRDGRELFFVGGDQKMMAVNVKDGANFDADVPKPLFDIRNSDGYFDVGKDGRFLIPAEVKQAGTLPITVVVNWTAGLKK